MAIAVVTRTSPQVRTSAKDDATGVNARVVLNPGCVDGELLIGIQSQTGGTAAGMTAPSTDGFAWTQRGLDGGSLAVGFMKVWYRVASNEPTTSWSFGGDGDGNVVVLVITNWDTRGDTLLWDGEPSFNTGVATATHVTPSVTMTRTTNRLIRAAASETGGTGHNTIATYTEHQDSSVAAGNSLSVQSSETAGAGTTGTVNMAMTSSTADYVAVSFSLSSPPNEASELYRPSVTLPHWSTAGNTLVALVGANSEGQSAAVDCMISSVVDSAHNIWIPIITDFAASSGDANTSVRIGGWYCPGAEAITWLTVTMTQTVDALGLQVIEASGVTNVSVLDSTPDSDGVASYSGGVVPPITTTQAGSLVVAAAVIGDSDSTLVHSADTWTTLTDVTTASGVADEDNVLLRGAYKVAGAPAAQSTTWTLTGATGVAWVIFALKSGSLTTSNPNANWPQVTHEIAFGNDPNDPSDTLTWTNVTSRVLAMSARRGRSYELARTQAGEADVQMRNNDGALDPGNTGSAYYPNVRVLTPYRCRAVWNGLTWPVFTGYVERWPQTWDNQFGNSPLVAVDGLATLSATRLSGTLGSEILEDGPFAYWPLDDGRLAQQAANKATLSSTALSIAESVNQGGSGTFSANLDLQGEESTCWQQTRNVAVTSDAPSAIYGKCLTATMTLPQLASGVLLECWAKIPSSTPTQTYCVLALKATGFAETQERVAVLTVDSGSGLPQLDVAVSAGTSFTSFSGSASGYNDDAWHHYVVHLTTTTAKLWVDGTARIDGVLPSVSASTIDRIYVGGLVDSLSNQNIAVASFAHAAIFTLATADSRRVSARANSGLFGFPERSGARISRLLSYAGWTAGRAIDEGYAFLGAANTIAKQTLLQAVQDVANWENGLAFVDAAGNFRFVDRGNRFYRSTVETFGDSNTAGAETPYETDVEIEYDPKYVFNDVTITRASGKSTGSASSHKKDAASILAYFTRTLDKTSGVSSVSQCEAEATWVLENYAEPRMRLANITIVPSTNPTLWPIALSIEIGDRVQVKRRPFGGGATIILDCYVEEVSHKISPDRWSTTYSLSPALLTTYDAETGWILNASALDVDTIVG